MIASLRGPVLASGAGWAVVEINGVGMRVELPSGRQAQATVAEESFFHTSLIVREDSLTLFGFETLDELEVFGRLIAVSGVGPRSALGVLSSLAPVEIARAVSADDEKPFRKVSGIGPKTAKLIVVSLAGKLPEFGGAAAESDADSTDSDGQTADNVRDGLMGLGWGETDARQAVQDAREAGAPSDDAGLLRAALSLLQAARSGGRGGAR